MQDPTSITTATFTHLQNPQFPEQEQLKCPRCDSNNTKFCYYNNYNLSQPRHYCKSCRRYWTKGGALRNIPIGGGTRKTTKKSSSSSSKRSSSSSAAQTQLPSSSGQSVGLGQNSEVQTKPVPTLAPEVGMGLVLPSPAGGGVGVGSFSSLLGMASEGQFGDYLNGLKLGQSDGPGQNMGLVLIQGNSGSTSIIGGVQNGDQSCWGGSSNNGLSNLGIYTQPGAKFQ